jgi:SAM-dependent methyltransferase
MSGTDPGMTLIENASSSKTIWTEEKIRATLASEPYNYQAIQLPFGLKTQGHDRSATAEAIFTGDWRGQSVLDVGSSLGFFLFEAKRRDAGRCVGMDLSADNVRRASTLADILNMPVEFRFGDIDAGPVGELFDNVLCLNVIHHLVDPILGMNRLIEAAGRRLVLEVATVGSHDRKKLGISWLQSSMLEKLPAIIVGRGTAGEGIKQFYLTISAIENLLRYRRGCFASVEIKPSGFKNRFLVVAEKRKIDQLLVTAGAPGTELESHAAGIAGGAPEDAATARRFGMQGAPLLKAADYHKPQKVSQDRVLLEYNIMRPLISGAMSYSHDPAVDVILAATETTFLTLWDEPAIILARLQKAIAAGSGGKQLKRAFENMSSERDIISRYRNWFSYTKGKGEHWIRTGMNGSPRFMTVQEWEEKYRS